MVDGADHLVTRRQLDTNAKDPESVKGLTQPLYDLLPGFANRKVVRVLFPLKSLDLGVCVMDVCLFFFYSGSSTTLSPSRSGESCLSRDQRETPLMCSTEVNQTSLYVVKSGSLESSGLKLDPG